MEEHNTNIEQWLREAAARLEQEQTPVADKQAAWDAMRTQLDKPARGARSPWKRWFGGGLLAGVVLISVLFVVVNNRGGKQAAIPETTAGKGTPHDGNVKQIVRGNNLKPAEKDNRGTPASAQFNTATNEEEPGQRPERENGKTAASGSDNEKTESGHSAGAVNTGNGKPPTNEENGRAAGQGNNKTGTASRSSVSSSNGRNNAPHDDAFITLANAANTKNHTKKASGNRSHHPAGSNKAGITPLRTAGPGEQNGEASHAKGNSERKADSALPGAADKTGILPTSLHHIVTPLAAILRFSAAPDAELLYTRSRVPGEAPAFAPRQTRHYNPSGFSVQLSGNIPLNNIYGGNATVEYTFDLGNSIRLRPHLGGGYLTGFSESYKHHTFNIRQLDPSFDQFLLDSILTTYTATALGFGEAGVQVAYSIKRWELMAGLSYRYAFSIKGQKDSTFTSRPDSVRRAEYAPSFFSTGDLPGRGKLMLQAGVSYMLTPQLQGGLRYNLQVMGTRKGAGMLNSPPSLPLTSSLELQMRWYFRRNSKK